MRLIDADALTMLLHDDIDGLDEEFPNDKQVKPYMCGVKMALSFIDTAPTIDAVPVVRCKDCVYRVIVRDPLMGTMDCYGCRVMRYNEDDWFCSFGERRDDEADRR